LLRRRFFSLPTPLAIPPNASAAAAGERSHRGCSSSLIRTPSSRCASSAGREGGGRREGDKWRGRGSGAGGVQGWGGDAGGEEWGQGAVDVLLCCSTVCERELV
jgi:uncharacterized membrane protein